MAHIVILGAGLTGISTAYHLEQKGFHDYILFEKESELGGLCRSVSQDGFTFDYTGHLLHIGDAYFRSLIERVVGMDHFNVVNRRSYIYSQNTYTRYPYQINLYGLPTETIISCIQEFIDRPSIKHPKTFKEWVLTHFGAGLGNHFFFPYQAKIFAHDLEKITASWTQRFVPPTSLEQMLRGSLSDTFDPSIGYNAQFFYPKQGGIISWVTKIAQQLKQPVHTNFCVTEINLKEKYVTFSNGHRESYTTLVSTLPLDIMLSLIKEPAHSTLKRAQNKLLCNQVINFNLGIAHKNISDKHWIYFPESEYPFYRIGFPHNFSSLTTPEHCSSLYGEIAHINQSETWKKNALNQSIRTVKKLLHINDTDIATQAIIHIPHAYVIYDQWRDRNIGKILARLQSNAIHSIGRYGAWKYASMQESILDGKQMADALAIIPARKEPQSYRKSSRSSQEYHEVR